MSENAKQDRSDQSIGISGQSEYSDQNPPEQDQRMPIRRIWTPTPIRIEIRRSGSATEGARDHFDRSGSDNDQRANSLSYQGAALLAGPLLKCSCEFRRISSLNPLVPNRGDELAQTMAFGHVAGQKVGHALGGTGGEAQTELKVDTCDYQISSTHHNLLGLERIFELYILKWVFLLLIS